MNPRSIALLVLVAVLVTGEAPSRAALTVTVTMPRTESWPSRVRADGDIAAWQEAAVASDGGGQRIVALHAEIGDVVQAGQLLVELDTASVRAALAAQEAGLAEAEANLATAASDARRAEELRAGGTLTAQQITQYLGSERAAAARLAAAQAQLDIQRLVLERSRITAPDAGVVIARDAVLGQVVQAGTELFRIIRQGRLEWRAEVIADDLPRIRVGQQAHLDVQGGGRIMGTVRAVAPTLSTATRTAIVYVDLPADGARAGMFANGEIVVGDASPVLTVPATAVLMRDGRSLIFAVDADGTVRACRVGTGRRQDDRVEITSGLDAGTRLVVAGGAFLNDGDRVTVAADKP